ncbi:MAG: glycosyltransferase family 4 protein [Rhodospirillaceae bacterium]
MPPKLLYLVTEDYYFWSHRLPMARAAQAAGFDVAVAGRVDRHREQLEAAGFSVHPLGWRRQDNGLWATLRAILEIAALYRRERPDIVHHVALKPVILGGLAARLSLVPAEVNSLTGLGFVFIGDSTSKRLMRRLIRFVLNRCASRLIVQNHDDHAFLVGHDFIEAGRVTVIRGSGVDIDHYRALTEPVTVPITVAYVGRMLEDKGVHTLVEAHRLVRERGVELRLLLVGQPDNENPTSIPESTLRCWAARPGLEWRGFVADVRSVWAEAHFAVLPSRREGLPKSLLEAAACGRAMVATDVPGCREIARPGENALLVPADDPASLAEAMITLACNPELRASFAAASRALVLSDLANAAVGARTIEVYRTLLADQRTSRTT